MLAGNLNSGRNYLITALLTCLVATMYVRICMWQSVCRRRRRLYVRVAYSRGHTLVAFVYVVIVGLEKRRES